MARNRNPRPASEEARDRTRTAEARRVAIERRNIRREKYAATLDIARIAR